MNKTALQELTKIVGEQGLLQNQEDMVPFLKENRGLYNGYCSAVIRPASTEEVSEVVKCCNRHGITITPQSGNTGLCGGAVPSGGILINMGRMNKIIKLDRINSTMTVNAGCILADLQAAAKAADLMFTLSCPAEKECQIGGNLSTNLGGVNVLRYGNTRDLVLGLEVVLPSGEIWNGLRALRKDNAGYDLKHLFIGAEGTLGIITAATIKLYPYPKVRQTAMVAVPSISKLMEVFVSIRTHFSDHLSGFEILPRSAINFVCEYDNSITDPFPDVHQWYGLIELNATDSALDLHTPLKSLLNELPFAFNIAANEDESNGLWAIRDGISEAQKAKGASIKHDVSLPINRMAEFISEATRLVEKRIPGVLVCGFGHAGDGNVHFNLTQPADMDKKVFLGLWKEINQIVHNLVDSLEGSIAAEHGVGKLKYDEMEQYKDPVEYELMKLIKRTIDPKNLFNPEKVINLGN